MIFPMKGVQKNFFLALQLLYIESKTLYSGFTKLTTKMAWGHKDTSELQVRIYDNASHWKKKNINRGIKICPIKMETASCFSGKITIMPLTNWNLQAC